jgi:ElaB/YqjD/DUF883 family membrane-anchored ribosome-binding protein
MTQSPGGSTTQMAKDQATKVGQTTARGGEQVAKSVSEQTGRVTDETRKQARNLLHEGRQQLTEQAQEGQQKAARGLHTLADELEDMYAKSDGSGIGPEVINQAAGHARTVASWLDDREPGDLLDEVRNFARHKPGMFLAGAAVAGLIVGRLTRGVVAAQQDNTSSRQEDRTPETNEIRTAQSQGDVAPPATTMPGTGMPETTGQPVIPGYQQPPAPVDSQPPSQASAGSPPPPRHDGETGQP